MRSLPTAAILVAALAFAPSLPAQSGQAVRLATSTELLNAPGGRAIAALRRGAAVSARATSGAFSQVVVEGFLDTSLVGGARDSFAISVRAPRGAMLRAAGATDAEVVAELRDGMGLARVSATGRWTRVRRTGWIPTSTLGRPAAVAAAVTRPAAAAPTPAAAPAQAEARKPALDASAPAAPSDASAATSPGGGSGSLAATRRIAMRMAPEGATVATVERGTVVTPLARERGWVRVRVEGWVPEGEVLPADTALRVGLSAADLRADPEGTRGRVVRWDVEVLALQTADPLRRDLARDEPYLLARGPGSENAVLYLAVPPSLLTIARSLAPLARVTVVARVRVGRSEPAGVPVLDLQSITRR